MAIDGESTKDVTFRIDDIGKDVEVTLKVKDAIHFKLLEKIARGLDRLK